MRAYEPGQTVLYRGVHVDDSGASTPAICDLKPALVVEDSPAAVSLFVPAGTPTFVARPRRAGDLRPWAAGEWELARGVWSRWHTLFVHAPGEWRSTWMMWSPEWQFLGWYVNLEEPLRRTRFGFDNRDLQLDIVVSPRCEWRWKDEDEFERAVSSGLIAQGKARVARQSGLAAIEAIEQRTGPFDPAASAWRPQAATLPALPPGETLEAVLAWPTGLAWDPRRSTLET